MRNLYTFFFCIYLLFPTESLFSQQGTLDPLFGLNGKIMRNIGVSGMDVVDVLQQSDGKILFAGYAAFTGSGFDFVLVRLNINGTRDQSFGNDGIVTTDISGDFDELMDIVLLQNGKILALGSGSKNAIVRYNANGSLDNSFSDDGILTVEIPYSFSDFTLQQDGKIIVAARASYDPEFIVMRFTPAGIVDSTFDGDGTKLVSFSLFDVAFTEAVAIQSDGNIIVSGTAFNSLGDYFLTIRLSTTGIQDMTFTSSEEQGVVASSAGPDWEEISKLMIQPDGKIVLSGYGFDLGGAMQYTTIVRYQANGIPDSTFDEDGVLHMGKGIGFFSLGKAINVQDNKMLLTGIVRNQKGVFSMALARVTNNGHMDNTFGVNGIYHLPDAVYSSLGVSVFVQQDGKYVIAGFEDSPFNFHSVVMRLHSTGTVDTDFATLGTALIPMGNAAGDDVANAMAAGPDDKLVVAGSYNKGLEYGGFLYRFTSDGGVDNSFGNEGKVYLHGSFSTSVQSVLRQPDGKLVVIGTYYDLLEGADVLLCRFHANGMPDSSFGINGRVTTSLSQSSSSDKGLGVALQSDGRIIVLAQKSGLFTSQYFLMRYSSAGVLDESFGEEGKVLVDLSYHENNYSGHMQRILVQQDNKILITGEKQEVGNTNLAVRRYNHNGGLDYSFNNGNIVSVDLSGGDDCGYALALQPDGKIIIAGGVAGFSSEVKLGIVRLLSDGTRDLSFDLDGKQIMESGGSVYPSSVLIQPDGKILAAGTMSDMMYNTKMIVGRWHPGGRPDSTWGENGIAVIGSSGDGRDVVSAMALQSSGKVLLTGKASFQYQDNMVLYRLQNTLSTGLNNYALLLGEISISPNPVSSQFKIVSNELTDGVYQLFVRSADGRLLSNKTIFIRNKVLNELISASEFPSGTLWITIQGKSGKKTFSVVKQ